MSIFFLFLISFLASIIGAFCGVGGGIMIKPLLDAFGGMDIVTVNFLSGCTVLAMSAYSVVRNRLSADSCVENKISLPLAVGAAVGGLCGKTLFAGLTSFAADDKVKTIQAVCLLIVVLGTIFYTLCKERIPTMHICHPLACLLIGLLLGTLAAFLGIGGGPINMIFLFFFFSLSIKAAAEYSLFIIFISQMTKLIASILTRSIPDFPAGFLVIMMIGGISGGIIGQALNKKMPEKAVGSAFLLVMSIIVGICLYNI